MLFCCKKRCFYVVPYSICTLQYCYFSIVCKLLEKIVCRQLVAHLEDNELIYAHQYGFQHGKSTEHNLIQLTNFLHSALNEKNTPLEFSYT